MEIAKLCWLMCSNHFILDSNDKIHAHTKAVINALQEAKNQADCTK